MRMVTIEQLELLCRALHELEYEPDEDALVWYGTPEDPDWAEKTEGCLRTGDRGEALFAVTFDDEGKLYSASDLAQPLIWWIVELAPYYLEEWELAELEDQEDVSAWVSPDEIPRLVQPRREGGFLLYSLAEWLAKEPASCEAAADGRVRCGGEETGWVLPAEYREKNLSH
jgi:hypothetical protein